MVKLVSDCQTTWIRFRRRVTREMFAYATKVGVGQWTSYVHEMFGDTLRATSYIAYYKF